MEHRQTHARITANERGEVEKQELHVVSEQAPDGPHTLASFEINLPDFSYLPDEDGRDGAA